MVRGDLGEVEYEPGFETMRWRYAGDLGTVHEASPDTAAARRCGVELEVNGDEGLFRFLDSWYRDLPEMADLAFP